MTHIFNTCEENPKMHIWCKFAEIHHDLLRGIAKIPGLLSRNCQNDLEIQDQCTPFPIPAESIPGYMLGTNFVILDQICGKLSCEQSEVYEQTDKQTTIPLRSERAEAKMITPILCRTMAFADGVGTNGSCHIRDMHMEWVLIQRDVLKPSHAEFTWECNAMAVDLKPMRQLSFCPRWFSSARKLFESTLLWRHNGRDGVSNHQPYDCLLNRLFRHRSKNISKLRITGPYAANPPVTDEFLAQMARNAENVSIWWRHHEKQTNLYY